jgi:hypothetical protein
MKLLAEALERYRVWKASDGILPVQWAAPRPLALAIVIADAYLAEHGADDAAPLTEEWMRRSGFYEVHPEVPVGYLRSREGLFLICDAIGWRTLEFLVSAPTYLPTRGHLRRLCRAVGVELKESG